MLLIVPLKKKKAFSYYCQMPNEINVWEVMKNLQYCYFNPYEESFVCYILYHSHPGHSNSSHALNQYTFSIKCNVQVCEKDMGIFSESGHKQLYFDIKHYKSCVIDFFTPLHWSHPIMQPTHIRICHCPKPAYLELLRDVHSLCVLMCTNWLCFVHRFLCVHMDDTTTWLCPCVTVV